MKIIFWATTLFFFGPFHLQQLFAKPIASKMNPRDQITKELYRARLAPESKIFYIIQLSDCRPSMISGEEVRQCQLYIAIEEDKKIISGQIFGKKMVDLNPKVLPDDKAPVQYSSGQEEAETDIKITPLLLAKDLRGLLITQTFGFEHVHREHFLFAIVDSKLKRVWIGNEGAGGPVANSTDVFSVDGNTQGFYFQKASNYSDAELSDTWNIQFFKWNSETKKIEEIKNEKERPIVWAGVVGSFKTVKDAHEYKTLNTQCLLDYQNLSSNEYPKLEKNLQLIALLSTDKSKIEKSLATAKTCDAKIEGYLKEAF